MNPENLKAMNPEEIKILKARHRFHNDGKIEVTVAFPDTEGYFERITFRDEAGDVACVHYYRVVKTAGVSSV